MIDSDVTLCEACGTALLEDEPSCWRCGHHPGAEVERPPRPLGVTALAVLNGVVALATLALAVWLFRAGARPFLGLAAAVYTALRGYAAVALWGVRPEGRSLQRVFSFPEIVLFPVGTVLSLLVLLYFRKPAIEVLFSGETVRSALPSSERADRGDETLLAAAAGVFALLAVAATVLFLVWGAGTRGQRSSDQLLAALPSCTEPRGVSPVLTEVWRLPMDRVPPWFAPVGRATVARDTVTKREGEASARIRVFDPYDEVPLGSFPFTSYRLGRPFDGWTVLVRARVRRGPDLAGAVVLISRVSDRDSMAEDRGDEGEGAGGPEWRRHELVYVAHPDDELETHDLWAGIEGPGTTWIDDVRLFRGPRFGSPEWRELRAEGAGVRPATGVEEYFDALTSGGGGEPDPLLSAYQSRPVGAVPPDRVQRCLTELLLAYDAAPPREPAPAWLPTGPEGAGIPVTSRMVSWRREIYRFHQPDYLERLVRLSPDMALVSTYGRDVVPHLLAHGEGLLDVELRGDGPAAVQAAGDPAVEELTSIRDGGVNARDFLNMTMMVVMGADSGRWELAPEEEAGFRALLEAWLDRWRGDDPRFSQDDSSYDYLVDILRRLGSDRVPPPTG